MSTDNLELLTHILKRGEPVPVYRNKLIEGVVTIYMDGYYQSYRAEDAEDAFGLTKGFLSDKMNEAPKMCAHKWETAYLFTGTYERCSRCGADRCL